MGARILLFAAMTMFSVCNEQYQIVYDALSFSLACMMSCTLFLWMRVPSIVEKYKSAVLISGLVTFIAAYHYIRIFNSWVDGYRYPAVTNEDMYGGHGDRAEPGRQCWRLGTLSALMILSGYKG